MKLNKIFILAAAAIIAAACSKDPKAELVIGTDDIAIAAEGGSQTFNINTNTSWNLTVQAESDWITVSPTSGKKSTPVTVTVQPNEALTSRKAVITITAEDLIKTLVVEQSRNPIPGQGEFLIEEVFFTGNQDEAGATANGEQYIKITNNTDDTLYADGLVIGMTSFFNSQISNGTSYWTHPELTDGICIDSAFQIPGNGTEHPVEAGKSLLIALAAQDFSAANSNAFNLAVADFEIYEENDRYPDVDNPGVPNMNVLFKSSNSLTSLHNRGFQSYAIIKLPVDVTAQQFTDEYKYDVEVYFVMNGNILVTNQLLSRAATAHKVLNDWVLDGINCGIEENFREGEFNSTVDAGYTGCGKVDKDESRFGKSVLRKSVNGKLVDTNNSTNDFTRDATPTLKK